MCESTLALRRIPVLCFEHPRVSRLGCRGGGVGAAGPE